MCLSYSFQTYSRFQKRQKLDAKLFEAGFISNLMSAEKALKKLVFPNVFGFDLPDTVEIQKLQTQFDFSDQYADFLVRQNGFDYWVFHQHADRYNFISSELTDQPASTHEELKVLFSHKGNDLLTHFIRDEYIGYFFPIGTDPAGNIFVEILIGNYKGYIGCINHEVYTQSAPDFIKEIGQHYTTAEHQEVVALKKAMPSIFNEVGSLKPFARLKAEEVIEFFVLYDWDFCSLTSTSFNSFINNILVIEKENNHFSLCAIDQSLNGKRLFE